MQNQPTQTQIVNPRSGNHKHTLIWIHGLNENGKKYLPTFQNQLFDDFKIIAPDAPIRNVTISNDQCRSWFDVKFRNQLSFKVPFDQAFSTAEVIDSFQNYIRPIILSARKELGEKGQNGKLIISGFSQGCGMSLHSFYTEKDKIDAVIGISGYLFPFTPFEQTNRFLAILYGIKDQLRPWEYVKQTYTGKIGLQKVKMIENTGHKMTEQMISSLRETVSQYLSKL